MRKIQIKYVACTVQYSTVLESCFDSTQISSADFCALRALCFEAALSFYYKLHFYCTIVYVVYSAVCIRKYFAVTL